MNINEFLQERRIEMNLSIQQLSKESDISASHISRMERGVRNPSPQTLKSLAEPLNVEYVTLLKVANLLENPNNDCLDIGEVLETKTIIFNEKEVPKELKEEIYRILLNAFNSKQHNE